mgnify:FL=1
MANGLLGKKVVSSRDTEVVYTVPAAKVATYNVNILNDGANTANVNVYISDKAYQAEDFSTYNTPKLYQNTYNSTSDTANTLDLIGDASGIMITSMKSTPVEPAAANTASTPIQPVNLFGYQDGSSGYHFAANPNPRKGNPLSFYSGADLYLRNADDGATYTMQNYVTVGGAATTAATSYGQTASDNIVWATNEDGPWGMSYVGGVPGGSGSVVNSINDWRATTATYNTAFTWGLGAISKISGLKTTVEKFIIGTTTGFCYMSNDDTPETQAEFQSNTMSPPTGTTGYMIGAASIATDATNGKLYVAYSGNKVAYATYSSGTPFPTTGYSVFDFPSGVTFDNVVDVKSEGSNFVIVVAGGNKYSTSDVGVTWVSSKHYAKMPISMTVQSIGGSNKFAAAPITGAVGELTFVRGMTYRIHQNATSNNAHPLLFSTTADGGHATGGVAYSTGMTFQMGNPSATGDYTAVTTTLADWFTNHATYNGEARIIEWTVPSDAPNTLYTYCYNHSGMGGPISIVDQPTTAPHDDQTLLSTYTAWTASNGDAYRKYDLMFNGELYMREKRFFELPQADKFDKAAIASNEIMERTGLMASAGEQLVVTSDQDGLIVRVYGIEE